MIDDGLKQYKPFTDDEVMDQAITWLVTHGFVEVTADEGILPKSDLPLYNEDK